MDSLRYRNDYGNTVAIFGYPSTNKFVRIAATLFHEKKYNTYIVNKVQETIEGISGVKLLDDIHEQVNIGVIYRNPGKVMQEELIKKFRDKKIKCAILPPDARNDKLIYKLRNYGIEFLLECPIVDGFGRNPNEF